MSNIVSKRIKEAMNIRNLKQIDIVKQTGINKGALSSYIKGSYLPKDSNLEKLSQVLKVNKMWLLGYDVPMEDNLDENKIIVTDKNSLFIVPKDLGILKKGSIIEGHYIMDYLNELALRFEVSKKQKEKLERIIDQLDRCSEETRDIESSLLNNKITIEKYQEQNEKLEKKRNKIYQQYQNLKKDSDKTKTEFENNIFKLSEIINKKCK